MNIKHILHKKGDTGLKKGDVGLIMTHKLELTCFEYITLKQLVDKFVESTAQKERESYFARSAHHEYWEERHTIAVHLREKFLRAGKVDLCTTCKFKEEEE